MATKIHAFDTQTGKHAGSVDIDNERLDGMFYSPAYKAAEEYISKVNHDMTPRQVIKEKPNELMQFFPKRWHNIAYKIDNPTDRLKRLFKHLKKK